MEILISDDGAGIDAAEVKAAAVKNGVISAERASALGESEALALIFHSGVSTSLIITTISGRGLGMAIVREKAEKLGGRIAVETRPGAGHDIPHHAAGHAGDFSRPARLRRRDASSSSRPQISSAWCASRARKSAAWKTAETISLDGEMLVTGAAR